MKLVCPECESSDITYLRTTTVDDAYDATGQRYKCRDCGYEGSIAVEPASVETKEDDIIEESESFPYAVILFIAIVSVISMAYGSSLEVAFMFFIIPTALLLFVYWFFGGKNSYPVEQDLAGLDEYGRPKRMS
jgi:hypothetical protein